MTQDIAARQQALLAALLGQGEAIGLAALPGLVGSSGARGGIERGLQAYRLNAAALSAKVLAGVYPRLQQQLGGDASFEAMAWAFWRAHPPMHGDLGLWGGDLADFLARQDGMPHWLCDLARLEWTAHQCERAADADLDVASLDLLASVEPARLSLRLRPGLALLQVLPTAWACWVCSVDAAQPCAAKTLPVVIWRHAWRATGLRLSAGDEQLMQRLQQGGSLEQALQAALAADESFDFSAWLQAALQHAWLQAAVLVASGFER